MFGRVKDYLMNTRDRQRIAIALSKGSAMMQARLVDLTRPETWEFSGFSQNGEDGILEILRRQLKKKNRYFIDIGAADGIESNTGWLVVVEQYRGLMVEGNPVLSTRARTMLMGYRTGVDFHNVFVTRENVKDLVSKALLRDPDVLSLDIDGNDYYVAEALLDAGIRPRIFVVEYNSVFGPARSVTIPYKADFDATTADPTRLYYGVSIIGWRKFFQRHRYRFVTVDRNGVNAFFVDPSLFDAGFLRKIRALNYAENQFQYRTFQKLSAEQYLLIKGQKLADI